MKGPIKRYLPLSPEDPADPYITAEATALSNDPNQIFAFVRDQVAFESYRGSVRGARGALWALAGNTLDKSSLLVALLEAAGYTAQYEHANIYGTPAQNPLILKMFPQVSVFVGCLPPGSLTDSPLNNGYVQQDTTDYYWVEYGPSSIPLDPNVPGATAGQAYQTPDSSFTTVPQNLRQEVTIKINAEIYSQASSLYGFGPSTINVLTQTFDASALVGNVITAGNLVNASSGGALDFTATTFTYTPFLLIGSGGSDVSQDQLITGTDYQELYTNFPLSSQVLTGLFLEIDADDYTYSQQPWTHTMFDRLGPAARAGNASVSLSLPSSPVPALTEFDLTTANINTARQPLSSIQSQQTRLTTAYNNYEAIKAELASVPTTGTLTDAQQEIVQQATSLGQFLTVAENELITMAYDYHADLLAKQLQTGYYSRVYPNSPRITIAQSAYDDANTQELLDVLKNDMFVVDGAGQNRMAPVWEEVMRGMLESLLESSVLNQATGQTNSVGIGEVFGALGDPNQMVVIGPRTYPIASNPDVLASTTLSADAQTLILNDVAAGNAVMTPNQMVTVNGQTTVGWWETNPNTGHTISHFANGGHQAIVEAVVVDVANSYVTGKIKEFIGRMEGLGFAGIEFAGAVLSGVAADNLKVTKQILANPPPLGNIPPPPNPTPTQKYFNTLAGDLLTIGASLAKASGPGAGGQFGLAVNGFLGSLQAFEGGLASGYYDGIKWLTANLPADPDVLQFVSTPLGPVPTPTPGSTPGVQVGALTVDPTYTMPFNGDSLPLVFDLPITNTGPSTDTFNIQLEDESAYFQVYPTIGSLTLLGGQTGTVNVCALPYDSTGTSVAPVGQAQNYVVTVTSATNPSITATASPTYNAPALPSLNISVDPAAISVVPGAMVSANLNLASVGNVAAGPMTLTATLPTGITLSGLTSPITVPLNNTATEPLSFTVASNVANGTYNIFFAASYTPSGGTIQQTNFVLPVTVTALGTCAVSSALSATQVGKTTLASDLIALNTDMNAAAAAPSNSALTNRVVGDMNVIINQELPPYFAGVLPTLTAATNAVASATPSTLLTALSNLSSAICVIGTTLNQANTTQTSMYLNPNTQIVGPNQTSTMNIVIANASPVTHVYNLSALGVPGGVGVQFSNPSIILGPAGSNTYESYSTTVTLTTGATFNTPFGFLVVATPTDAPEFAVSAQGAIQARPESINVDQVTATPQFGNPGTAVTVSARVFAVVNEQVSAQLVLTMTGPNGGAVGFQLYSNSFTLTPSTTVQTISFSPIDTTGYAVGAYSLSVQAEYASVPQGTAATGSLLIGSPLSGVLTANPSTVTPGSNTVQAALTINRDSAQNPISTLVGSVPVSGITKSMALFQNGPSQQLAYVCSDSYVNIVDVTNPALPQVLSTFANNLLTTENSSAVPGFQEVTCSIYNTDLIIAYSRYDGNTTANPIPRTSLRSASRAR